MKKYRVSNLNQRTILITGVRVVDTTVETFKALIEDLALRDAVGVWLKPYRGIPDFAGLHPFDLILISDENQVVDLAVAYPNGKLSELPVPAANALVLPLHSISSSSTNVGDKLEIIEADENEPVIDTIPGEDSQPPQKNASFEPDEVRPGLFIRILRFLFPTRPSGRAVRHAIPNVGAYYWTGGSPQIFPLGDISTTGFYLLTEERWSRETVVLMTLQRTNTSGDDPRDSLSVLATAVRWGLDGMGFEFVFSEFVSLNPGLSLPGKGTDRQALEQFIKRLNL
jgi:uncharacterized protein